MNTFNDRIRDKLQSNRLHGLREEILEGCRKGDIDIPRVRFETVFSKADFEWIEGRYREYAAVTWKQEAKCIGYPKWDHAYALLHLWKIESHLGLPRSFEDYYEWKPAP